MRLILSTFALLVLAAPAYAATKTAIFGGGCFWCMESEFQDLDGIESVLSGFSGGTAETANYEAVSSGTTDHREVVQITYDPAKISYETLLGIFWDNVDPFDDEGQFCDKGKQYTSAIFVNDAAERKLAQQSITALEEKKGQAVKTAVLDAMPFYPAEDYHQDYFEKNKLKYKFYRTRCGRDSRLNELRSDK